MSAERPYCADDRKRCPSMSWERFGWVCALEEGHEGRHKYVREPEPGTAEDDLCYLCGEEQRALHHHDYVEGKGYHRFCVAVTGKPDFAEPR